MAWTNMKSTVFIPSIRIHQPQNLDRRSQSVNKLQIVLCLWPEAVLADTEVAQQYRLSKNSIWLDIYWFRVRISRFIEKRGLSSFTSRPLRAEEPPHMQNQYSVCPLVATCSRRRSNSAGELPAEMWAASEASVSPKQSESTAQLSENEERKGT